MKILISPDSFKGSLTSQQVAEAIEKGIKRANPECETVLLPLADGGEGTAECLLNNLGGKTVRKKTENIFFEELEGSFIMLSDGSAVVESATASGIMTVEKQRLNPLKASTRGTGILIRQAVDCGAKAVTVTLGGSATNDGGMGALSALGVDFLDEEDKILLPTGENMVKVRSVRKRNEFEKYGKIKFTLACDVTNVFCGENGAARVFARQKGADEQAIELLDEGLKNLARIFLEYTHVDVRKTAGTGAAGGICGGLFAFLNAEILSGFDLIARATSLEEKIACCDLIITGEGRTDTQTLFGKLPKRICDMALSHNKRCILLSGDIEDGLPLSEIGFSECRKIKKDGITLENAVSNAYNLLVEEAEKIGVR